jgi:two-component system, OmpR family, response regulator
MRICNVLIVEHHEGVRRLLGEALDAQGYRFTLVGSGAAMREALGRERYDIAIVDVSLHGEDGFGLAEEAARSGLSVILTTADRTKFEAVERSGRRHVLKPFRMQRLLETVHEVLGDAHTCTKRKRPAD